MKFFTSTAVTGLSGDNEMKGRNILVLDLETQKSFKEVQKSSTERLGKLKISVVGVYDYITEEYRAYEEKDIMELEKRMRDVDLIIGFNHRRFDMPVLAPYLFTPIEKLPLLDLLDAVEASRGHRASLDSLARPTLNAQKSGSGLEALTLYRENRMEDLKKYCLDDVRLTKEIYEYGCQHGKVLFTSNWDFKTYEIPVSWRETTDEMLQAAAARQENFPDSLF